jgi:phosphohistidine phosphatase
MPEWDCGEKREAMELYILRHGIAEPARGGADDAGRALVPEGRKKLRAVLRVARGAGVAPELILTSPYRRAVETAELAAEVLGYSGEIARTEALVSDRSPQEAWEEIRRHAGRGQVLVSGHEPQLSHLAALLLGAPSVLIDLKKGSLLRIDIDEPEPEPQGVLRWYLTPALALACSG